MKAIGFRKSLPIAEMESFIEFETAKPSPSGFDLLVKVGAVSMNPVDFKVRQSAAKDIILDEPKIIGYDAVGTVVSVGEKVGLFKEGDEVYYAGDLTRSGSNAAFQLIDERIVGTKPKSLRRQEAAAIPMTGLTAWEAIFDRMKVDINKAKGKSILILAGAGGVGSIAIQIAKQVAGLTVIASASRDETQDWCKSMGADFVVNHHDLQSEMKRIGHKEVDYILDCVDINGYWEALNDIIKPQGHIVTITGSNAPLNLMLLKNKSVSFSWEFMFTRSMYTTEDIIRQHEILNEIADLVDKGILKSTLKTELKGFSVENFKKAHEMQESGKSIGKTVIMF
ncbi:zinc-binding alcohol dehydrogenase family protein [Cyclobacterium amurskyense]|uniref:Zinc-type alcohol dehydrogenase-like protein n=1 Tax=Cyclobacterium amurskyense TaxID=320787 RepID=A0A0H4PG47_9BACT|nr:zinc-binding alcohol dehydrogenase family protein [Cyclobacterium amurskyense]AKP52020.1 Bifunctional protein: zinc-containing alcohol dehydrogenase, quinone oxidoreductase (NADPH:quinone reductase) [Cyclobacterium amurskyense]